MCRQIGLCLRHLETFKTDLNAVQSCEGWSFWPAGTLLTDADSQNNADDQNDSPNKNDNADDDSASNASSANSDNNDQ